MYKSLFFPSWKHLFCFVCLFIFFISEKGMNLSRAVHYIEHSGEDTMSTYYIAKPHAAPSTEWHGAAEVALCLRALVALTEDLGLFPAPTGSSQTPVAPVPGDLTALLESLRNGPHMYRQTRRQGSHTRTEEEKERPLEPAAASVGKRGLLSSMRN